MTAGSSLRPVTGARDLTESPLAKQVQGALAALATGEPEKIPALVDALLARAHAAGASDLHLIARRDGVEVRLRIDGELTPVAWLPAAVLGLVFQRLKVMARLVVYQRREPQDGRIETELGGARMSLRVAFLPTLHGEQAVVRFPDLRQASITLGELGMAEDLRARFTALIGAPQGAVLLTGPASSGKTTTIYAALRHLVRARGRELNVLTVEDPVEAEIEGTTQTQVDPGANLDFPRALRAALRHDPNVLVVGEIRDLETAQTAIQAALAGHLLLATVHAGSAPGVFTRLAHLGVERYLLATAVTGVLNQRLARTVCAECARRVMPDEASLRGLGIAPERARTMCLTEGFGCAACHGTGCRGRVGVFELLAVSAAQRQAILDQRPETELAALAHAEGQATLAEDLIAKVSTGLIAPREALRLMR